MQLGRSYAQLWLILLPQAILGITEAFKADSNPKKINLGQSATAIA